MSVLSIIPSKEVLEEIAQELGVNESFVEKDWYAVQVISAISQLHYPDIELVFSGGTCLSKAHGLIKRFSEDIDFRVRADHSSLNRKSRSRFKNTIVQSLKDAGFIIPDENVGAKNDNQFFSVNIEYSSVFSVSDALRPHILLEVTFDNPMLVPVKLPIYSFVREALGELPEVTEINCISPVEVAANKLSALTWRALDRIRGGKDDDPSLVRHIHDLAALETKVKGNPDFLRLVKDSFNKDNGRVKNNPKFSSWGLVEKIEELFKTLNVDKSYSQEYERFVRGASYDLEALIISFDRAVECLRRLADHIIHA
jgi:predicted nucleotidyltransferase component of viral defense system